MSSLNSLDDIRTSAASAYHHSFESPGSQLSSTSTATRTLNQNDIDALAVLEYAAQDILTKYHAAMRQMEVRLEALDQDLRLRQRHNPIHHIESRMKSIPSIFEKLERYKQSTTLESMEKHIMDIAGLRVIVSYVQDVYDILHYLQLQDDLTVVTVKDYIASPKPNGYRSLHMIVRIPVYFMDKKEEIPVEIQIRTIAMDFWASLEHDLKYKAVRNVEAVEDVGAELKECSQIIEEAENRMQVLAAALEPDRMSAPKPHVVDRAKTMELDADLILPPGVGGPFAHARPSVSAVNGGSRQPAAG